MPPFLPFFPQSFVLILRFVSYSFISSYSTHVHIIPSILLVCSNKDPYKETQSLTSLHLSFTKSYTEELRVVSKTEMVHSQGLWNVLPITEYVICCSFEVASVSGIFHVYLQMNCCLQYFHSL